MFITPSFKNSLIVEQFQGNYLNIVSRYPCVEKWLFDIAKFLGKKVPNKTSRISHENHDYLLLQLCYKIVICSQNISFDMTISKQK